jgi:L-threonylcarbamoyladenylate synthase
MLVINEKEKDSAKIAAEFLRAGKIISLPTDTVYGLAVDASNNMAVDNLYQIKKRAPNKPIAIFVKDIATAKKFFFFDKKSEEIAEKFLPGALTMVLKVRPEASSILAKNLNNNDDNFLGFRIVDSFFINELFKNFCGILAVTSANISGENTAKNSREIEKNFPQLDLSIESKIHSETASTVVRIANEEITILRQGPIFL